MRTGTITLLLLIIAAVTTAQSYNDICRKGIQYIKENNFSEATKCFEEAVGKSSTDHEKVYALANEMLDRVGQFMKKYQAIGKALDNAQKAFEDGEKKLQPSGQSILQTCAKLQKLGAKQSTVNPLPQINTGIEE